MDVHNSHFSFFIFALFGERGREIANPVAACSSHSSTACELYANESSADISVFRIQITEIKAAHAKLRRYGMFFLSFLPSFLPSFAVSPLFDIETTADPNWIRHVNPKFTSHSNDITYWAVPLSKPCAILPFPFFQHSPFRTPLNTASHGRHHHASHRPSSWPNTIYAQAGAMENSTKSTETGYQSRGSHHPSSRPRIREASHSRPK